MNELAGILGRMEAGDQQAAEELLPLVYHELRKLAAQRLAQEKPGQTLQATALVHEAYLRLMGGDERRWDTRGHFFATAAEAMRRILVERARRKRSPKHGGDRQRVDLDEELALTDCPTHDFLALNDALGKLSREDPAKANVVNLRFFAGLSMPETAKALGISLATAERHWSFARAWLFAELKPGQ